MAEQGEAIRALKASGLTNKVRCCRPGRREPRLRRAHVPHGLDTASPHPLLSGSASFARSPLRPHTLFANIASLRWEPPWGERHRSDSPEFPFPLQDEEVVVAVEALLELKDRLAQMQELIGSEAAA